MNEDMKHEQLHARMATGMTAPGAATAKHAAPRAALPPTLQRSRLMAILRSRTGRHLTAAVGVLVEAGVVCLEVTLNPPALCRSCRSSWPPIRMFTLAWALC